MVFASYDVWQREAREHRVRAQLEERALLQQQVDAVRAQHTTPLSDVSDIDHMSKYI